LTKFGDAMRLAIRTGGQTVLAIEGDAETEAVELRHRQQIILEVRCVIAVR
jgi:hypothetical protein